MKPALLSRTLHKWLGLLIGLQLVLWTVSGFYMVVVDLDFIHGDPLVRNLRTPVAIERAKIGFAEIAQSHPQATQISLRALPSHPAPVYEVSTGTAKTLIDAVDGSALSPLPEKMIQALARSYYAGKGTLHSVALLKGTPPLEIQTRALPLWRADFDDWLETSLYIHPETGTLVTRRHRFWRWFDFFWMLHIMDYEQRIDMNNVLLRVTTIVSLIGVGSGIWLLYFSFRRRAKRAAR
jgi:uncharacterized iron-regulated membrane protein